MQNVMFKQVFPVLGLCLLLLVGLTACGSDDGQSDGDDVALEPTSPENLLKLVYADMQSGGFDCASQYYFGENRITLYFDSGTLGPEGTVGVCLKIRDDAQSGVYADLIDSAAKPVDVVIEDSGDMPRVKNGQTLNYAEGTLKLDDGSQLHINRMVEHEGRWYVLVLLSYNRFY